MVLIINNYLYLFRRTESETKLDRSGRLLGQVKTGVDHLAEKLKHIKTVSTVLWQHIHVVDYHYSFDLFLPSLIPIF